MKKVYFVRHGESEGNIGLHFQGYKSPLTERGREQARIVAERCMNVPIDAIISSSMKRAEETADIISKKTGHTYEINDLFTERRRPTVLLERSQDDPEARELEAAWARSVFEDGPRVLDGENFEDIKVRAEKAFHYLERHAAQNILVVAHGLFLRMMLTRMIFGTEFTSLELRKIVQSFRMQNTGITVFQYGGDRESSEDRWRLLVWNDHAHLG
jgi:broad specificity phosphatase PhoE